MAGGNTDDGVSVRDREDVSLHTDPERARERRKSVAMFETVALALPKEWDTT